MISAPLDSRRVGDLRSNTIMTIGSPEVGRSINFGRGRRLVQWLSRLNWSNFGLVAAILLMSIVFAVLNPNFYSETNLRNVARQTSILGIAACGQTIVIFLAVSISPSEW